MGYNRLFDRDHGPPLAFETLELDERICKTCETDFLTEKAVRKSAKCTGCVMFRILQQASCSARGSKGCYYNRNNPSNSVWFRLDESVQWGCDFCQAGLMLQLYTLDGMFPIGPVVPYDQPMSRNCHPELDRFCKLGWIDVGRHVVGNTPTDAAMSDISQ